MTKILITGKGSFIGRNFLNCSRCTDVQEVSLLDKKPENIDFTNVGVVLHLAAIVHQNRNISKSEYFRVNRDLCIEVARQAKKFGVKQFVFLSSVKVYGRYNPEKGTWNESSKCEPEDPYGQSKYEAEQGLRSLEDRNFTVTVIRPPLVYGTGVKANMLSIIKLVDKFPVLPLKNISNKRSFVAVENLIHLIDTVIEKRTSGIFLPMDEKPLSTTELAIIISKCLNKKTVLFKLPDFVVKSGMKLLPKIFDRLYGSFEIDNTFTKQALKYQPVISTEKAIEKMVNSYRACKKN